MPDHKPGDRVPQSGIYKVVHDTVHTEEHEVTAVLGEPFPPCNDCGDHPRFTLLRAMKRLLCVLAASLLVSVSVQAQTRRNLLMNPGFELPVISNPNKPFAQDFTKTSSPPNWQVEGDGVVTIIRCPDAVTFGDKNVQPFSVDKTNFCDAKEGRQYLDLSGQASHASVSQRVPTTAGALYYLSFNIAAARYLNYLQGGWNKEKRPEDRHDAAGVPSRTIRISVTGDQGNPVVTTPETPVTLAASRHDDGDHPLVWDEGKQISFRFRANSAETKIAFSDITGESDEASFIDNVALEPSRYEITQDRRLLIAITVFLGLVLSGVGLWYLIRRNTLSRARR